MFFTLEPTKIPPLEQGRVVPPWVPEAPSHTLMLALEPRLLFDASGLIAGLDLIPGHESMGDSGHEHGDDPSATDPGPEPHAHDPAAPEPVFDGTDTGHFNDHFFDTFPADSQPDHTVSDLVIIDPRVEDYQSLVSDLPDTARVVVLDPGTGGVDQILAALSQHDDIQTIHIVSHGESGSITLGNTLLSSDTIDQYSDLLADWGDYLSDGADILIYGCNVSSGTHGQAFVAELADITGADVAASDDLTGAADLGGDWNLETRIGIVESTSVFSDHAVEGYTGTLAEYTVTQDTDHVAAGSANADDGLTLREAIALANTNGEDDTITFDAALEDATITLKSAYGALVTDEAGHALTIDGEIDGDIFDVYYGANPPDITVTMDAPSTHSIFKLSDTTVTLTGLGISGNDKTGSGGGIYSDNTDLTLDHSIIENNTATLHGGGIYQKDGDLMISYSDISGNRADDNGGGIYHKNGKLNLDTSYLGGNYAQNNGGGIHHSTNDHTDTVDISNSYLYFNGALNRGGGIYHKNSALNIHSASSFIQNIALQYDGGGIYHKDGNLTVSDSYIYNNLAYEKGGGIFHKNGDLTVDSSIIAYNSANPYTGSGGGIYNNSGGGATATIRDSVIYYNDTWAGGGISSSNSSMIVEDTIFTDNLSAFQGGGISASDGTLKIYDSIFDYNAAMPYALPPAETAGGSIASVNNNTYIYDSTISYSYAYNGGGILADGGTLSIYESLLNDNTAYTAGGGIFNIGAQVSLVNSTISGNAAPALKGGGIYSRDGAANPYVSLHHCTLAYNTGDGIYHDNHGSITLGHTIVANDITTGVAITSNGYNLFSQNVVTGSGGSDRLGVDAGLTPLADNGGPTRTHALKDDSIAIDTGDPGLTAGVGGTPATDQRGGIFTRVEGTIDIGAVEMQNFTPNGVDDNFTTNEDTPFTTGNVLDNDTDPNVSDTLIVTGLDTTGTQGRVTDNGNGTFDYDPNGQFEYLNQGESATDTFTYTVSDGKGGTDTATVTITVTGVNEPVNTDPVNHPPEAEPDGFTTDQDTSLTDLDVLDNDTDPDSSDTLTVSDLDTTGTKGKVTDNGDGTFDYDPNGQFDNLAEGETDTDTFTYTISDGNGGTDTATVTITITGKNDAPHAMADEGATDKDTAITTGNVLDNDTDPDASDSLTVTGLDTTGTKGQVLDKGDGTFTYDPNGAFDDLAEGETDTDTFTYTVSDGHGGTDTAMVTITVTGKSIQNPNTPPTANPDQFETDKGTALTTGNVLANDTDPDASDTLTVTGINTTGTKGIVTANGDGTFNYDPNGEFDDLAEGETATDTFTYTVSDGNGGTDTAAVTITITGNGTSSPGNNDTSGGDSEYLLEEPATKSKGGFREGGGGGFLRSGGRVLSGLFSRHPMDPMAQAHGHPFGPGLVPGHEGYEPPEDEVPPEDETPAPEGEPMPEESAPPEEGGTPGESPPADGPREETDSGHGTGPDEAPGSDTVSRRGERPHSVEGEFSAAGFSEQIRVQANRFEQGQRALLESLSTDAA